MLVQHCTSRLTGGAHVGCGMRTACAHVLVCRVPCTGRGVQRLRPRPALLRWWLLWAHTPTPPARCWQALPTQSKGPRKTRQAHAPLAFPAHRPRKYSDASGFPRTGRQWCTGAIPNQRPNMHCIARRPATNAQCHPCRGSACPMPLPFLRRGHANPTTARLLAPLQPLAST